MLISHYLYATSPLYYQCPNPAQSFAYEAALASHLPAGLAFVEDLALDRAGLVEDGFHLYYTSGTTGRPKGVVLSQRIVLEHAIGTVQGAFGWRCGMGGCLCVRMHGNVSG